MNLTERLNVLVQATLLSQKNGVLTLEEAVKVKSAIDIISSGKINQDFTSAINLLIENAVSSQKKGIYTFKDAHMIYIAINGIEEELQNEVNKLNKEIETQHVLETSNNNNENVIVVPPKKLKKNS